VWVTFHSRGVGEDTKGHGPCSDMAPVPDVRTYPYWRCGTQTESSEHNFSREVTGTISEERMFPFTL
jgi:hypothetical protein